MFGFMQQALRLEVQGWKLVLFTLVFLPCASQLAVALMNWLCGWNRGAHLARHVRVHAAGPEARSAGMEARPLHPCFPALCQPTRRGADELAVHAAGEPPPSPAP